LKWVTEHVITVASLDTSHANAKTQKVVVEAEADMVVDAVEEEAMVAVEEEEAMVAVEEEEAATVVSTTKNRQTYIERGV
jgi:hypothetical protein